MEVELKNTIRKVQGGEQMEFDLAPEGMGTYGLVQIKNCTKKHFKSQEDVDAFRFIFRHRNQTQAFVFLTCTTSFHERSNLYKTLKGMTGKAFNDKATEQELFELMCAQVGKWFDIMVEHNKGNNGKIYANIVKGAIMLNGSIEGSAVKYFNGVNEKAVGDKMKQESKGADFDSYPDAEVHYYDLTTCPKDKINAARKLLTEAGAKKTDPDGLLWEAPSEVVKLAKFKHLPIEKDDVPF